MPLTRASELVAIGAVITLVVGVLIVTAIAQTKGDPKAGEPLYKAECAKCHGPAGVGDGPQGQKLKEKPTNWSAGGGGLKGMDD